MERAIEGVFSLGIVQNVIMGCYLADQTVDRTILKNLKGNVW
jgi:hypothetical protein